MKVILQEPGFENLTGFLGRHEFVNGKSVEDIPSREACRMAACMKATWEDGRTPTLGEEFGPHMEQSAPVEAPKPKKELKHRHHDAEGAGDVTPPPTEAGYTAESLGAIADKEGIAGIRRVADQFDVRAKKITDLIEGILKAQAEKAARGESTSAPADEVVVEDAPAADVPAVDAPVSE